MKIEELQKALSFKRALIPILIGVGVISYIFLKKYDKADFVNYDWSSVSWLWVVIGLTVVVFRHLGYMYRIRILTDKKLTWRRSFNVISLWELASAISPSAVGGTAVAMFILQREKISMGRSTAIAISTLFLDLLYLVLFVPILFIYLGKTEFFGENVDCIANSEIMLLRAFGNLSVPFMVGYVILFSVAAFLAYGLFKNPLQFKVIINRLFSLPVLRKWKSSAKETGEEVVYSSRELSHKPLSFWAKAFGGTVFSWTARFFFINCLVLAFSSGVFEQVTLFARYFLLWIIMVLPSTPGASGVAELSFSGIFCQFLPNGAEPVVLVIWRLFSYYFYIILGLIILPMWLRSTGKKKPTE